MFKGINKKNVILMHVDAAPSFSFRDFGLLGRPVKNRSPLGTDECVQERKKCSSNKKLISSYNK